MMKNIYYYIYIKAQCKVQMYSTVHIFIEQQPTDKDFGCN